MARAWYFNNGLLAAMVTLACAAAAGCDDANDGATDTDAGDAGADGSVAHGESGKGGTSGHGGRGGGPNDPADAGDKPSSKDSGVARDAGGEPREDAGTDAGEGDVDDEDAGDEDEEEVDPPNYVFVTSIARAPGALDGLDGADDFCNERAAAGELDGTFVAWLSTPNVDARDRLGTARGWVSPDGLPFADRVDDIIEGRIWYPPTVDELGEAVRDRGVITGTADDGTFDDANTACANWTVSSTDLATSGDPNATTQMWSDSGSTQCDSAITHVFCFGVDYVSPIDEPAEHGRLAFVSAASFVPNASTTPDKACQDDADAANLAGTFKALLAHEGSSAASRFDLEGEPWVRPDGVRVVGEAADLATDGWLAPINVQADGTYIGNYAVWLGAAGPGDSGSSSTCGDWADNSNTLTSYSMAAATSWPFANSMPPCDADYVRLFCLEE